MDILLPIVAIVLIVAILFMPFFVCLIISLICSNLNMIKYSRLISCISFAAMMARSSIMSGNKPTEELVNFLNNYFPCYISYITLLLLAFIAYYILGNYLAKLGIYFAAYLKRDLPPKKKISE